MLPHSEACERNKGPILGVLRDVLRRTRSVLEIGSGTGQHAVHFARHLPQLTWWPSDRIDQLPGLAERVAREGSLNLKPPLELDVTWGVWPVEPCDAVYTANTLHIMSWPEVQASFTGIGRVLRAGGVLAIYGPFRYRGACTSESNERFDEALRRRDPASGIRDFEAVQVLAAEVQLTVLADHPLPANNRLILWQKNRLESSTGR